MNCLSAKRILGNFLFVLIGTITAVGQPTVQEQSNPEFVRASLLITAPTDGIYTAFGHSSIRLECPSNSLDYVFTFATDPDASLISLLTGRQEARMLCIETANFLSDEELEGRCLKAYELNLAPQQEVALWRLLDQELVDNRMNRFNLETNCVTAVVELLTACVAPDTIVWADWDKEMALNNGNLVRFYTQAKPWSSFLLMPLIGSKYAEQLPPKQRMDALRLVDRLQRARLSDTTSGAQRFLLGNRAKVLRQSNDDSSSAKSCCLTPSQILWTLLLLVAVASCFKCSSKAIDAVLLCIQSTIAVLLLWTALSSDVFGNGWNWYFIPYNLLPLVLWVCFHGKAWFPHVYACYSLVLLCFLTLTPLLPQLDWTHQLLTLALLIRCIFNSSIYKYIKNEYNIQF